MLPYCKVHHLPFGIIKSHLAAISSQYPNTLQHYALLGVSTNRSDCHSLSNPPSHCFLHATSRILITNMFMMSVKYCITHDGLSVHPQCNILISDEVYKREGKKLHTLFFFFLVGIKTTYLLLVRIA